MAITIQATKSIENAAHNGAEISMDSIREVLVVDDSASQRVTLSAMLKKWGYEVRTARDGQEALDAFIERPCSLVISDWLMPGMDGTELCTKIRELVEQDYCYFILLTSKTDKRDVADGLNSGADDYLSKPVDKGELLARLQAGNRILSLQLKLVNRHEQLAAAHRTLELTHAALEEDLMAASKIQQSCIPQPLSECGSSLIATVYKPCTHVSGDLVGYFQISDDEIAAYSIDVSGHGVAAALLSVSLAHSFSLYNLDVNVAFGPNGNGEFDALDPDQVVAHLNGMHQGDSQSDQYFTMVFARIRLDTGHVRMCQAGHPNPAILRNNGDVEFVGAGGAPVGLLPFVEFDTVDFKLEPGERFFLYSDGVTECEQPDGEQVDEDGLARFMTMTRDDPLDRMGEQLLSYLEKLSGSGEFDDDVSGLCVQLAS